jgi:hypothetical protein
LGFEDSSVIDDYVRDRKKTHSLQKSMDILYTNQGPISVVEKAGNILTPRCHDIQPEQFQHQRFY